MLSQADSASSFLRFSLSEGYIDENIEDYLTIYTGERISPNDRYLIRQIRSGQRLPFETRIDSISKFTADLNEHDLKKPGILLRGIIEYGVRSQEQNAQEKVNLAYSGAIEALVRSSAEAFTEMFEALVNDITDPYRSKLLKDISTGLHHDWTKYQGSSTNIFGLDLLTVISVDDMSGVIATLKGLVDFIDTDDINILQNKEALGKQRVDKIYGSDLIHVTRLDGIPSSDFMDYLIHSGSIRLTPHTMESIILSYAQPPTQIPSYRLVQKLAIDLLTNFIDSNINCFVQIELDTPDSISEEDGHSFVQLLQNELLEEPLKQQLITAYSKNDIELETIPTEYQLQVVRANIYRHDWMNLQFAFTNMEPESIRDILSETNYFGDLSAQFSDEYSDLLVELVDNYQIQFNRFNRNLITTRNDYFGANQSDEVLREMIELNIVQISPELIERVTNQESLLRLTVNRVLPDTESWSEVDQQLFAKLSLEKLLDLIFNSNDRYLSFQCIAVKQVVNKHLFDDSLSDDDRQRLISVILEMPTVDVDAVRKVFSGFLNFDNQMDALYKLTQSDKIENAELVELFSETDCYALKNLVRPDGKPGGYVKFKNEKNIKELLLAFKERGLIGKSKTLKNGGIQVFRRKRSW